MDDMKLKLPTWLCDWFIALWVISIAVLFVSSQVIASLQIIDAASLQVELQQMGRYVYVVIVTVGLAFLAYRAIYLINHKHNK